MLDTVIFDMDGLLIDSEPLWGVALREVFASVGVNLAPELAHKTTGLRTPEVVAYWYRQFRWKGKSPEQVSNEIIESVTAKILREGLAMEGVSYILDFFAQRGFKMGLASSSPLRLIESVLQYLDLNGRFAVVSSAEFEPYGKPHPAVYLSCAEALGSGPHQCLSFEYSVTGMIAAKAARMKVVAVPERHNRANPKYVLADLQLESLLQFQEAHLQALSHD